MLGVLLASSIATASTQPRLKAMYVEDERFGISSQDLASVKQVLLRGRSARLVQTMFALQRAVFLAFDPETGDHRCHIESTVLKPEFWKNRQAEGGVEHTVAPLARDICDDLQRAWVLALSGLGPEDADALIFGGRDLHFATVQGGKVLAGRAMTAFHDRVADAMASVADDLVALAKSNPGHRAEIEATLREKAAALIRVLATARR